MHCGWSQSSEEQLELPPTPAIFKIEKANLSDSCYAKTWIFVSVMMTPFFPTSVGGCICMPAVSAVIAAKCKWLVQVTLHMHVYMTPHW